MAGIILECSLDSQEGVGGRGEEGEEDEQPPHSFQRIRARFSRNISTSL